MEADFCLAKHLGMNQGTRGTRLFARRPLPPRQGLHAFVRHRQNGGNAGGRFEIFREEQTRKCSQSDDTVCHLIHFPFVLIIPPEETSTYASESRKLTKIHHSATRISSSKAFASLTSTFLCRNPHRLINNFAFKFFSMENTPNGRNLIFHIQLIYLSNS